MKKVVFVLLIFVLVFFQLSGYAQDEDSNMMSDFEAMVIKKKGTVEYKEADDWWKFWAWASLEVGDELKDGDVLKTGNQGIVELEFVNGSRVLIGENSNVGIVFDGDKGEKRSYLRRQSLKLELGQVWVKTIDSLSEITRFKVRTPNAVAGVRGTLFSVSFNDEEVSKLSVKEGKVSIANHELEKIVVSNQEIEVDAQGNMGGIKEIKAESNEWQKMKAWTKEVKQWADKKEREIDDDLRKKLRERLKEKSDDEDNDKDNENDQDSVNGEGDKEHNTDRDYSKDKDYNKDDSNNVNNDSSSEDSNDSGNDDSGGRDSNGSGSSDGGGNSRGGNGGGKHS
jgi:uncharacterized membrane protein YgcG